jgi:psiF repeat
VFKGPNAPMALYFDYQDAQPNYDLVGIMVSRESENFYPCERTKLLYASGSINCKWVNTGAGNGKVTISRNGISAQELTFNVTGDPTPPGRAPLDIRPEAQLSASTSIEAAANSLLSARLSTQECSRRYQDAKTAGTLNGQKWNDFRKSECGADASAMTVAPPVPADDASPQVAALSSIIAPITPLDIGKRTDVQMECSAQADAKGLHGEERKKFRSECKALGGREKIVFPTGVSPQYSSEDPGKGRMHTCVDQYNANKATNGNGGMKWIEQGGGYYTECDKRLKG